MCVLAGGTASPTLHPTPQTPNYKPQTANPDPNPQRPCRWDSLSQLLLKPHLRDAIAGDDPSTYSRAHLQRALSLWNSNFTAALLEVGLSPNAVNLDGT